MEQLDLFDDNCTFMATGQTFQTQDECTLIRRHYQQVRVDASTIEELIPKMEAEYRKCRWSSYGIYRYLEWNKVERIRDLGDGEIAYKNVSDLVDIVGLNRDQDP